MVLFPLLTNHVTPIHLIIAFMKTRAGPRLGNGGGGGGGGLGEAQA